MPARPHTVLGELFALRHLARGFSYLPKQPVHSLLAGSRASRLRGRGLNFEEIRGYLPGDDIRAIDWKVTARTGKPHTRVFTEERDRPVLMLVDQRINMFFGSQRCTKAVAAAELCALSAWRVLAAGDRPGAIIFNDSVVQQVRPHRSEVRVTELLNLLHDFNHRLRLDRRIRSNGGQLNEALGLAAARATHDTLVVLISDLQGADEKSARLVSRIAEHNDVLVCFVYDPIEAALPAGGRRIVSDGELQLQFDGDDNELRHRYTEEFDARLANARDLLRRREVPVLTIATERPVVDQVREQLGQLPQGRTL